jgi:RNA polymerase-binding transcription factor DksA
VVVDPEHPSTPSEGPDLTILTRIESELGEVDRALGRLDEGTYGTCAVCGGAIGDERLAEEPAAAHCAEHQPT